MKLVYEGSQQLQCSFFFYIHELGIIRIVRCEGILNIIIVLLLLHYDNDNVTFFNREECY